MIYIFSRDVDILLGKRARTTISQEDGPEVEVVGEIIKVEWVEWTPEKELPYFNPWQKVTIDLTPPGSPARQTVSVVRESITIFE